MNGENLRNEIMTGIGGPMGQPAFSEGYKSIYGKEGAHYNIFEFNGDMGTKLLRQLFPEGEANEMNFVLFSTSGVHGSYTSLETIEKSFIKYGEDADFDDDDWPEDYDYGYLTILIIQPRIVCMRYGIFQVELKDIPYLKK